jgi:hypothetical protein
MVVLVAEDLLGGHQTQRASNGLGGEMRPPGTVAEYLQAEVKQAGRVAHRTHAE